MNKCKNIPAKTILCGSGAIRIRVDLALLASDPDPVAMKYKKRMKLGLENAFTCQGISRDSTLLFKK